VRGDGNCYYRAVCFGGIEHHVYTGHPEKLRRLLASIENLQFTRSSHAAAHTALVKTLGLACRGYGWPKVQQLEQQQLQQLVPVTDGNTAAEQLEAAMLDAHDSTDAALVRACRKVVANFLSSYPDRQTAGGLTYRQIIEAEGSTVDQVRASTSSVFTYLYTCICTYTSVTKCLLDN
jgi:Peptidase C65 Otubain